MIVAGPIYAIVVLSFVVAASVVSYRFITSSDSRLYSKMLRDVLGPFGEMLTRSPRISDLRIKGPLQITRISPARIQLPMSKGEFVKAFERLAPGPIGRALTILSNYAPDQEWKQFLNELPKVGGNKPLDDSSSESFESPDVKQIRAIGERCLGNFSAMREELWKLFPDVNDFIKNYDEFLSKFSFALRRRNFRQNVVIAGILVVWEDLTFTRLFNLQRAVAPEGNPISSEFFGGHGWSDQVTRILIDSEIVHIAEHFASFIIPSIIIAAIAEIIVRRVIGEDLYGVQNLKTEIKPPQ